MEILFSEFLGSCEHGYVPKALGCGGDDSLSKSPRFLDQVKPSYKAERHSRQMCSNHWVTQSVMIVESLLYPNKNFPGGVMGCSAVCSDSVVDNPYYSEVHLSLESQHCGQAVRQANGATRSVDC